MLIDANLNKLNNSRLSECITIWCWIKYQFHGRDGFIGRIIVIKYLNLDVASALLKQLVAKFFWNNR